MLTLARYAFFLVGIVIVAMLSGTLGACSKQDAVPKTASAQGTVPPPPGDSTPKAVDSSSATSSSVVPANENKSGDQSTVGTASSGSPPETQSSAPEGNPSSRNPTPGASTAPNTSNPTSVAPNAPAPNTTSTEPNKGS